VSIFRKFAGSAPTVTWTGTVAAAFTIAISRCCPSCNTPDLSMAMPWWVSAHSPLVMMSVRPSTWTSRILRLAVFAVSRSFCATSGVISTVRVTGRSVGVSNHSTSAG
jgi:hypothetical protein